MSTSLHCQLSWMLLIINRLTTPCLFLCLPWYLQTSPAPWKLPSISRAIADFPIRASNTAWLEWPINHSTSKRGLLIQLTILAFTLQENKSTSGGTIQPRKDPPCTPQLYKAMGLLLNQCSMEHEAINTHADRSGRLLFATRYNWMFWLSMMTLCCTSSQATKRYIMKSMFWRRVR